MNEIWEARRESLEEAVRRAVLDLFEHTGSAAFKIEIFGTSPPVSVISGTANAISDLTYTHPIVCSGCGGEINPDYGKCLRCD